MVGKGEVKSSRIFHQCYVKCCKLQNLVPLNIIIPSSNGKALDFCVDRIKYVDWAPILNALSCDLSLHSAAIKCRQPIKSVLEHIDCERLAKTVNKRAVILTNFMLNNLIEALSQLLTNTTLLMSLLLEGLPVNIPYLNPLCDALLANNSLQHLYLQRCLIGDAGCMAICKAVRCLPNILTMDLGGCELTPLGAGYIAELIKYQKIHRYSENWIHTLRYRLPELDTMAGLRRISLSGNPQLGDAGVGKLFEVLADDLWIKALDIQNCGVTEHGGTAALQLLRSNTTLVVLDVRYNQVSGDTISKLRLALRHNERGMGGQYVWLNNVSSGSSDGRPAKPVHVKSKIERVVSNGRTTPRKYTVKTSTVKKERDYTEMLEEQLQEEISHRQQLEELNVQLVDQLKRLKQHQIRLWANAATSSGSEQSFQASSRSGEQSNSSGSSSIPIDQNTLSYIQQAFRDIYGFIKNNQCHGECLEIAEKSEEEDTNAAEIVETAESANVDLETDKYRIFSPKRSQSSHVKYGEMRVEKVKKKKITKSMHVLGALQTLREEVKPDMIIERQVGDVKIAHGDEMMLAELIAQKDLKNHPYSDAYERGSHCSVSDSDTLVCSPAPNPRLALFSSSDEDS